MRSKSQILSKLRADGHITDEEYTMLAQEPCEDAISRQAVLDQTYLWSKDEFLRVTNPFDYLRKRINDLPLVTPQPKTGHWILLDECSNSGYYCSECQKKVVKEGWSDTVKKIKFCPNCGAKMVEPQESEKYCDRNICIKNEYNDIGCDECEVTKSQEQKTGHWIEDEYEMKVWCSECGEENDMCSKYCPNCGAKMAESEE